jgi:hypothetical protein
MIFKNSCFLKTQEKNTVGGVNYYNQFEEEQFDNIL